MMKRMGGAGTKRAGGKSRKGKKRKGPGGGRVTAAGGPKVAVPDLAAELEATLGGRGGAGEDDLRLPGLP